TGNRKPETGNRKPETGNRKPETGNRKPETGNRPVYGLDRQWLVRDGVVVPSGLILSHESERERLARSTPEALDAAIVAGDPCLDRMHASRAPRSTYRRALGAGPDTTVITLVSTWGDESLFGRHPELPRQLLAELDTDHVVAAVLHPNVWYAHGPWQIKLWLGDCLRAGLRLVPPTQGWQQTIIASDLVIGDHSAVTGYAACLGRPVLLAAFPEQDVAAGSAIAELGALAPRLDHRRSLRDQVRHAIDHPSDFSKIAELASSTPGESASLLRAAFYRAMNLPEPSWPALVPPFPAGELVPERREFTAFWVRAEQNGDGVRLTRWPAAVTGRRPCDEERHLVVHVTDPHRHLHGNAAVVVHDANATDAELIATLDARPVCQIAATATGRDTCRLLLRNGRTIRLRTVDGSDLDPTLAAAAIHHLAPAEPPPRLTITTGSRTITVDVI
ncbi:hypothetical protein, partial [Herbihabitans rhizosphaerae]|uniref:hypothetical protein n=1 Tax=Herbihabitans rhizosphaerae TaxID=1872711 RepID=UPI001A919C0E